MLQVFRADPIIEERVLSLLASGLSFRKIAEEIGKSRTTVGRYVEILLEKELIKKTPRVRGSGGGYEITEEGRKKCTRILPLAIN